MTVIIVLLMHIPACYFYPADSVYVFLDGAVNVWRIQESPRRYRTGHIEPRDADFLMSCPPRRRTRKRAWWLHGEEIAQLCLHSSPQISCLMSSSIGPRNKVSVLWSGAAALLTVCGRRFQCWGWRQLSPTVDYTLLGTLHKRLNFSLNTTVVRFLPRNLR